MKQVSAIGLTLAPPNRLHQTMQAIAFKEWAIICEALGLGQQSIILRKGGIAEGRAGFRFEHEEFFLFPTRFHEQIAKTVLPAGTPLPRFPENEIEIQWCVRIEKAVLLTDWDAIQRLAPFHIWSGESIRERFEYDELKGVHLAIARVYALNRPWVFPDAPAYGGCRSWVKIPEIPTDLEWQPVLTDAQHEERIGMIEARLSGMNV